MKNTTVWTSLLALQEKADSRGHGESWRLMCENKTIEAAKSAAKAAHDPRWHAWTLPTLENIAGFVACMMATDEPDFYVGRINQTIFALADAR